MLRESSGARFFPPEAYSLNWNFDVIRISEL